MFLFRIRSFVYIEFSLLVNKKVTDVVFYWNLKWGWRWSIKKFSWLYSLEYFTSKNMRLFITLTDYLFQSHLLICIMHFIKCSNAKIIGLCLKKIENSIPQYKFVFQFKKTLFWFYIFNKFVSKLWCFLFHRRNYLTIQYTI